MNRQTAVQVFAVVAIIVGLGISYFPPPVNAPSIWALVGAFLGHASRDLFGEAGSAPAADKQAGFARVGALLVLAGVAALALTGCGTVNAWTGGMLNAAESGYVGARQNVQSANDQKFILWADAACALPLGALSRNATGNPEAVNAALTACPVPNLGIVSAKDGQVQVRVLPSNPTRPYTPPATPAGQ